MENTLTNEQVLKVTSEIFAKTVGNLQDHQLMQTCLKIIETALASKNEEVPK